MKIIKELPINGSVVIDIDKQYWHGNYGDKKMNGRVDIIESKSNDLLTNILEGIKFIEKFNPNEENHDVPYMDYGDVDLKIEHAFIIHDDNKPQPRSWKDQYTYDTLHEAIESIIGGMPYRTTYILRSEGKRTEYREYFKDVVELIYNDPTFKVEGMDLEEEEYIDKLKQYLVLVELSK